MPGNVRYRMHPTRLNVNYKVHPTLKVKSVTGCVQPAKSRQSSGWLKQCIV